MADEKTLAARSIEMWGSGDFSLIDQTFDPDYRNHQIPDIEGGTKTLDLTAWRGLTGGFHESFSDIKVEILLQVGDEFLPPEALAGIPGRQEGWSSFGAPGCQ